LLHSQIFIAAIVSINCFIPYLLLLRFNILMAAFPIFIASHSIINCCILKYLSLHSQIFIAAIMNINCSIPYILVLHRNLLIAAFPNCILSLHSRLFIVAFPNIYLSLHSQVINASFPKFYCCNLISWLLHSW